MDNFRYYVDYRRLMKFFEDIFDEVDLYDYYTVTVKKNTELPNSFIVKIENEEEQFYFDFTEEYDKQNNTYYYYWIGEYYYDDGKYIHRTDIRQVPNPKEQNKVSWFDIFDLLDVPRNKVTVEKYVDSNGYNTNTLIYLSQIVPYKGQKLRFHVGTDWMTVMSNKPL